MNKNAILSIRNNKEFMNDIWQMKGSGFTQEQWEITIKSFSDTLKALYDFVDDGLPPGIDLYILGDVINMLDSIDVEVGDD